jgi:hypothetical protein
MGSYFFCFVGLSLHMFVVFVWPAKLKMAVLGNGAVPCCSGWPADQKSLQFRPAVHKKGICSSNSVLVSGEQAVYPQPV